MRFLVTGGAGFIGSAVVRHLIKNTEHEVLVVDALTYAGNLNSLASVERSDRYFFEKADICNSGMISDIFDRFEPDVVMHLAAESHVDRSIDGPSEFMQTNILGTFTLLEVARKYVNNSLSRYFLFHHISTDEVFGDLGDSGLLFTESSLYDPSSPYSASKAASDHLVRSWGRTYGLPYVITNCSNNYGPFHFPEKLIPHVILRALARESIPVYGDGSQIRDWLYVEDHARALVLVAESGLRDESFNIGGHNEKTNISVVQELCRQLDIKRPLVNAECSSYSELITFVQDRPGHDIRYAIDASKVEAQLGWIPEESFESGIEKTVTWYLENENWWKAVMDGTYRLGRLGEK